LLPVEDNVIATPADVADRFSDVRDFIQLGLVEHAIPSIAVAAAKDGRVAWEVSFGWADREARTPATPHTMYALASITKPVTATAIMILKERGVNNLDRPINEYLGHTPVTVRVGNQADATVRRVLNRTAGLPLHYQFAYADEPLQLPSLDESIRRYGNAVTVPGERFNYSNLGYGILGAVIERCSGMGEDDLGYRRVRHEGGMMGASTVLLMIPSEAVAVAVVSNSGWRTKVNRVNSYSVAEQVLAQLIPTYGERLAARGDVADERTGSAPAPFSAVPELLGGWRGSVHTHVGPRALTLWFKESGDIHALLSPHPLLARPPKTLVNEAKLVDARLSGRFLGTLDTPDTRWYHQYLDLDLRLRGHVLNGATVAYADFWDKDDGAAPGKRGGNALSFWTTLEKSA
jgi:hypothetical protein